MRAIVPATLAVLFAAGVAACQSQEPPAPAAAPVPTAFAGDLRAVGTEPFWGLSIAQDQIVLDRLDFAPLAAANPGPEMVEGRAVWRAQGPAGAPLVVTLWEAVCSDGMSDLSYPYQARVDFDGLTLSGCAARADAMPREGG